MKKVFYTLLLACCCLLAACSKDSEQDYTSVVIRPNGHHFRNFVLGYYSGGRWVRVAALGNVYKDSEFRIELDAPERCLTVFFDAEAPDKYGMAEEYDTFVFYRNRKNLIVFPDAFYVGFVNKNSPYEYPME